MPNPEIKKIICPNTGRPYPNPYGLNEASRKMFDKRVPKNIEGADLPPVEKRDLWWTQTELCDGLIGLGDWMYLAHDETWWDWTIEKVVKDKGDFNSLRVRMKGAIEAQKRKVQNILNNQ